MVVRSTMDTFFFDWESFYSAEYQLSKLDPPSYILDQLFEPICLGVAKNADPPFIVDGPDIPDFLNTMPRDVAVVSHNQLFDACIASWRYNYVPKLIIDTLAMSRTLLGHLLKSHSLRAVAKHLGLPEKGDTILQAKGMTRADLIACEMWDSYTAYCLNDVELCRSIYLELAPMLPDEEFVVHDLITRCAVEPRFRLNTEILAEHLAAVRAEKEQAFAFAQAAGVTCKTQLMSNIQFAQVLRNLGVDPPIKISTHTNKITYAFSRQDVEFMELREHEDHRVQAVIEARLGHKTTLEETRTERMLNIAQLDFAHHGGTNTMPIPLKIGAAITHRFGGDWKLNCQNWGRQSPIRRAVAAPEGYVVVACDAAQIEARLTAWLAGQWDMVGRFAQGIDEYAEFASFVYGYPINKWEHPGPRFVGKTGVLQLGYQSGWQKFQKTVLLLSSKDGEPIELNDDLAKRIVYGYRDKYWAINQIWTTLQTMIAWMCNADGDDTQSIGPITFTHNMLTGPNGLKLHYHDLGHDPETREWTYNYGGRLYKIFGGKLLENIIQFLARVATMQAAVRIRKRTQNLTVHFAHQAHDELIYLCLKDQAEILAEILTEEMSRTPDWAPHLPLKGETKLGLNYGQMKGL